MSIHLQRTSFLDVKVSLPKFSSICLCIIERSDFETNERVAAWYSAEMKNALSRYGKLELILLEIKSSQTNIYVKRVSRHFFLHL